MAERPILFSGPMVQAILAGRKMQTRRVLKPIKGLTTRDVMERGESSSDGFCTEWRLPRDQVQDPPYQVGDLLWVREAWRTPASWDHRSPSQLVESCLDAGYHAAWCPIHWEADSTRTNWADWHQQPGRLRASIHLPRAYSRITLRVTAVKVERLQEISEADAMAEGCDPYMPGHGVATLDEVQWLKAEGFPYSPDYKAGFQVLWESINGPDSWEANPWVAAYTFERVKP